MSFSFGTTEVVETVDCPPAPSEQPPNKQCGKLQLSEQQEVEVFYPVPFRYTPNLQVESPGNLAVVVDQKPDRFRIKHPYRGSTLDVSWQARGVPITAPVPTDAPLPIGPQPTPLPAPFLGQAQEETDQTTSSTEP